MWKRSISDKKTISIIVRHTVCPCYEHEIVTFCVIILFLLKTKFGYSLRHLFAPERAASFSSRWGDTLPCFLEALGRGHFSFHNKLVCPRHLQTAAQHRRAFFFFPVALHVIFPPCTMKCFARQMSRRWLAPVIQSSWPRRCVCRRTFVHRD